MINAIKIKSNSISSQILFYVILIFLLMSMHTNTFATDLLSGTTDDIVDTMNGTGRQWLLLIDVAASAYAFHKTKSWPVFLSVLGVAIGLTTGIHFAGF